MIRKIILGFVVLSFFIWNVFAETITTDKGIKVDSEFYNPSTDWNVIHTTTENTYWGNTSLYNGTAKTTWTQSNWNGATSSNTTTTSSNISSADYKKWIDAAQKNLDAAKAELNAGPPTQETLDKIANAEAALKAYQDAYNQVSAKEAEAARDAACESSWDCLDKPSFVINTWLFSTSGEWLKTWEAKSTINGILWTIIKKLMIALWVISLLIMTIWTWYIILYHGEDEYLSKWKSIFTAWIIALVISLSSYYMVNLVWYILYK